MNNIAIFSRRVATFSCPKQKQLFKKIAILITTPAPKSSPANQKPSNDYTRLLYKE